MDERTRPVGGPTLLDGSGAVKTEPRCAECGQVVDLSNPDHHVCIPAARKGDAPRKVTASVAAAEAKARAEKA